MLYTTRATTPHHSVESSINAMNATPLPVNVDVQTVKRWQDEGEDFILLDCREQVEFDFVRIPGSQLIPMSEIQQRFDELLPLRERKIVVHCHHGGRSLQVTNWLRQQDFTHVQNMSGGIDAWSVEIDSSLPRYQ